MRKRDEKKNRREIIRALSMVLQIGLAMMTCMGISLAIGYYIDRLTGFKYGVLIMLFVGILAAFRSLFILTGRIGPDGKKTAPNEEKHEDSEN